MARAFVHNWHVSFVKKVNDTWRMLALALNWRIGVAHIVLINEESQGALVFLSGGVEECLIT